MKYMPTNHFSAQLICVKIIVFYPLKNNERHFRLAVLTFSHPFSYIVCGEVFRILHAVTIKAKFGFDAIDFEEVLFEKKKNARTVKS